MVSAECDDGEDMQARREDVTQALGSIRLPTGAKASGFERINPQQFPVIPGETAGRAHGVVGGQ